MDSDRKLLAIKLLHTIIWAVFAGCIVLIPLFVHRGDLRAAVLLIGIVLVEVAVIAVNRGRCPLTPIAARYTTDRRPNFDIFLPAWLARYNKVIFGAWFVAGVAYAAVVASGNGGAGCATASPASLRQLSSASDLSEARRLGLQGEAGIEVLVGISGNEAHVAEAVLVRSSGSPLLDRAAMYAVRYSTFQPATCDGLPVPGKVVVNVPLP